MLLRRRSTECDRVQRLHADVWLEVGGRHFAGEQDPAGLALLRDRL